MDGYLLLADGTRLSGTIIGPPTLAVGWVAANTAVVGFQEMVTDPAYKGHLLAFTYPEIGNVGTTAAFAESAELQIAGLVVKVLSPIASHCWAEDTFQNLLASRGVPCLADVDTRWLAVHLRQAGEMFGAIVSAGEDLDRVRERLRARARPTFQPTASPTVETTDASVTVAVLDLGVRASELRQLRTGARLRLFGPETSAAEMLAARPAGVYVSDGPGAGLPPPAAVETIAGLLGRVPILATGLGHVALGLALGCQAAFLTRGHHGANYPVRDLTSSRIEVTVQRHTTVLDRDSVRGNRRVALQAVNVNDQSVEGIRWADGQAVGVQGVLAPPHEGALNPHIAAFLQAIRRP